MRDHRPGDRHRALWMGVAVAAAWLAWLAWVHRGHFVDDAFIGLRSARNLLTGHGLVFNPGQRVEAVTNAGWVVAVAGVAALSGGVALLPVTAKALGLLSAVGAVALVARAYGRLVPDARPVELLAVPLLAATQPELAYFSVAGMETGCAALLLALGLWCLLAERPRLIRLAVVGAVLFTVRPETLAIVPAVLAVLALAARRAARSASAVGPTVAPPLGPIVRAGAVFAGLVAAVTAARIAYYGAPLPNTFIAKAPPPLPAIARRLVGLLDGLSVNVPVPYSTLPLLAAVGLALAWALAQTAERSPTRVPTRIRSRGGEHRTDQIDQIDQIGPWVFLAAATTTGLLFGVYAPRDWTGMGRYFGPYVPLAALLAVRGLALGVTLGVALARGMAASRLRPPSAEEPPSAEGTDGAGGAGARGRAPSWAVGVLVLLLVGLNLWRTGQDLSPSALRSAPGFILAASDLVPAARAIGARVPPGAVIATRRIGALGYFADRPVFDFAFGLTDPRVARLVRAHGGPFDAPTAPELDGLWREVAPAYVLCDREVVETALREGHGGPLRIHGLRYREIASYPVGETQWVLAERVP